MSYRTLPPIDVLDIKLSLSFISYWVCEKSDGVRVLFLIATLEATQKTFIVGFCPTWDLLQPWLVATSKKKKKIDRHNTYREILGLYFPHYENPMMPLGSSLVDGELVIDVDPRTRQVNKLCLTILDPLPQFYLTWVYRKKLAFWHLIAWWLTIKTLWRDHWINDMGFVIETTFFFFTGESTGEGWNLFFFFFWFNLQRLTEWFYKPYARMIVDHPRVVETQPFGYVGQILRWVHSLARDLYKILASKLKKSIFLTMLRRSSMWKFRLSNMATMGLFIPASVRHIRLERIPICETSFFRLWSMCFFFFSLFVLVQTEMEASIWKLYRF